jgi:N-acyl homoserine lactone hydrolase
MHPLSRVPVAGYLVEFADGKTVLIDTGFADSATRTKRGPHWFRVVPEDQVGYRLHEVGLAPQHVQFVICSHFDPDHCGANSLFPHATIFVQQRHYEFVASSQHPRFDESREQWDRAALDYRLIHGDREVLPGVTLIETSGHVPGHQSVLIELQSSRKLLLAIDAIRKREAFDPANYTAHRFDMDPTGVRRSIAKLRSIAHSESVDEIFFGHDPEQWTAILHSPESYT